MHRLSSSSREKRIFSYYSDHGSYALYTYEDTTGLSLSEAVVECWNEPSLLSFCQFWERAVCNPTFLGFPDSLDSLSSLCYNCRAMDKQDERKTISVNRKARH